MGTTRLPSTRRARGASSRSILPVEFDYHRAIATATTVPAGDRFWEPGSLRSGGKLSRPAADPTSPPPRLCPRPFHARTDGWSCRPPEHRNWVYGAPAPPDSSIEAFR